MLVCYALTIDIFMLVRNLSRIRPLLAKGKIKDMMCDRQGKKAE
jgi:hypothetical protein